LVCDQETSVMYSIRLASLQYVSALGYNLCVSVSHLAVLQTWRTS
jgi:hypothetical protein